MVKDVIYQQDIRDSMLKGFRDGYDKGKPTHFRSLVGHYSWLKKDVTLIGGIGGMGKSTFFYQLAALRAKKDGEKFAIFSPEQSPPDYFYNDIIHMVTGIYPEKRYMGEDLYFEMMDWVNDHFFYVYPEDDSPTPDYINSRFERLIGEHGVAGVCVDPFNQLVNDWDKTGRDDRYISAYLQGCKRFANKHDVYYHVIVHPKASIGLTDEGEYRCPHVFDLAGGAMWNNHADNIMFVHRPYFRSDKMNNEVLISINKIKKYRVVGVPDDITLRFDRTKNRYMDDWGSPFDSNYGVEQKDFYEVEKDDPF